MKILCFKLWLSFALALTIGGTAAAQDVDQTNISEAKKLVEAYGKTDQKLPFLLKHANLQDERSLMFVARELAGFRGPAVIAALRQIVLRKSQQPPEQVNAAYIAVRSLQWVLFAPDFVAIQEAKDPTAREALIKGYFIEHSKDIVLEVEGRTRRWPNSVAQSQISAYIDSQISANPSEFIPLLMKYAPTTSIDLRKYRDLAIKGLNEGLRSSDPELISASVRRVGLLKAEQYLPLIVNRLYRNGGIEYYPGLNEAESVFIQFGDKSLPVLEDALYSNNTVTKIDVIGIIARIGTPSSLAVLERLKSRYPAQIEDQKVKEVVDALNKVVFYIRTKTREIPAPVKQEK